MFTPSLTQCLRQLPLTIKSTGPQSLKKIQIIKGCILPAVVTSSFRMSFCTRGPPHRVFVHACAMISSIAIFGSQRGFPGPSWRLACLLSLLRMSGLSFTLYLFKFLCSHSHDNCSVLKLPPKAFCSPKWQHSIGFEYVFLDASICNGNATAALGSLLNMQIKRLEWQAEKMKLSLPIATRQVLWQSCFSPPPSLKKKNVKSDWQLQGDWI